MISSELEELLGTADRIVVMNRGEVVGEIARSDFDRERIPERVVHALHPGTLLDTQMVRDAGVTPRGPASRGAEVILGVVERALLSTRSGEYFDELAPARAKPPAYEEDVRAELRAATLERLRGFGLR